MNRQRVLLAARLLERANDTIAAVSVRSGFGSSDTLRRQFIQARGVTADRYRRAFRLTRNRPGTPGPTGHQAGQNGRAGPSPNSVSPAPGASTKRKLTLPGHSHRPALRTIAALIPSGVIHEAVAADQNITVSAVSRTQVTSHGDST